MKFCKEGARASLLWLSNKLLYTAYLVNGPKVSASNRKAITALSGGSADEFRQQVLQCITDDTKPLPAQAEALAGELRGTERSAMLRQQRFDR